MAWFKVDDGFWAHPKVLMLSPEAGWLWLRAGSWSAQQLTDGFIPRAVDQLLGDDGTLAAQLVDVGLWEVLPDGWAFHGWDEFQPTRNEVEELRRKRSEAGKRGGKRSGESRRSKPEASASRLLEAKSNPVPSRPVPTPDTNSSNDHHVRKLTRASEPDDQSNLGSFFEHVRIEPVAIRTVIESQLGLALTDQEVFGLYSDLSQLANGSIRNGQAYILKVIQDTPFEVQKLIHARRAA